MPAKVPTKKATRTGLTKEARQKKIDAAISVLATLIPGGVAALTSQKGVKALIKKQAKEKDAMRWKVGKKSETIAIKKGGSVKKRDKGGSARKVRV